MAFYRLIDDTDIDGRWFVGGPSDSIGATIDPRRFTCGQFFKPNCNLAFSLRDRGEPLDFTFADFDVPVVASHLGELLEELAPGAIQRIPISIIDGESSLLGYEVLNVLETEDCIDENRSNIQRWTADSPRPDKEGQYRMVTNLTIDPSRTGTSKIFRISGWEIALVVSEDILLAFGQIRVQGVRFAKV